MDPGHHPDQPGDAGDEDTQQSPQNREPEYPGGAERAEEECGRPREPSPILEERLGQEKREKHRQDSDEYEHDQRGFQCCGVVQRSECHEKGVDTWCLYCQADEDRSQHNLPVGA